MKNKFLCILALTAIAGSLLVSCTASNSFTKVGVYGMPGYIKDYDSDEETDCLKRIVLENHLPDFEGDAAFADVNILGKNDGKIYTVNICKSYRQELNKMIQVSDIVELAEFYDLDDKQYKSLSGNNMLIAREDFLPQNILKQLNDELEIFDWMIYYIGKMDENIKKEAEEYFSLK